MTCKRCGECCCSVVFTDDERYAVRDVARRLGVRWKPLVLRRSKRTDEIRYLPYTAQNSTVVAELTDYMSLVDADDVRCPFLGNSGCACYENRPRICREFGTLGNIKDWLVCERYNSSR